MQIDAEPKSIEEIKRNGVIIKGATKGKDSILYGISLLQENEFKVTKQSTNLIKELSELHMGHRQKRKQIK